LATSVPSSATCRHLDTSARLLAVAASPLAAAIVVVFGAMFLLAAVPTPSRWSAVGGIT
jgi:hypothetical protein